MITFLTILVAILSFSLLFCLRYLWLLTVLGTYIRWVTCYLYLSGKYNDTKFYNEHIEIWPTFSVMIRVWDWRFRNFVVRQDYYDNVIAMVIEEINKTKNV